MMPTDIKNKLQKNEKAQFASSFGHTGVLRSEDMTGALPHRQIHRQIPPTSDRQNTTDRIPQTGYHRRQTLDRDRYTDRYHRQTDTQPDKQTDTTHLRQTQTDTTHTEHTHTDTTYSSIVYR